MTNKPNARGFASLHPRAKPSPTAAAQQRASLDGLEVQESNFGQWLAAGGDRRSKEREEPAPTPPVR